MLKCNMTFIQYKIYVYIVFLGLNFLNHPTFVSNLKKNSHNYLLVATALFYYFYATVKN